MKASNRLFPRQRLCGVYQLIDPRDQSIRYIGVTKDPQKRMVQHLLAPLKVLKAWVIELKIAGLVPQMHIVWKQKDEFGGWGKAKAKERELIFQQFKLGNTKLLNYHFNPANQKYGGLVILDMTINSRSKKQEAAS